MSNCNRIYRLLQQHLDKQAVGFPATVLGSDIHLLKKLFTIDEAKVALHLSYKPAPTGQIAERIASQFSTEQTGRMLDSMRRRSHCIFPTNRPLRDRSPNVWPPNFRRSRPDAWSTAYS